MGNPTLLFTGLIFFLYLPGCGGKSVETSPKAPEIDAAAALPQASPSRSKAPPFLEPESPSPPRLRVGLTTAAEALRLTSSAPFHLRSGSLWFETHDLLVEKQVDAGLEGHVYRVQVGSFLSLSAAERLRASIQEEFQASGRIAREPVTGRFAVRVGNHSTASGAEEECRRYVRFGFEGARVIAEPSSSYRPTSLVLRRAGAEAVRTPNLSLLAFPGTPGAWVEVDGRPYRGYLEISVNTSNRFTVVNILNLEDYLKGVVPAELSPAVFPQLEAIKAQAVAARTYAVRHLGQYAAEGFDICSTPACQVYQGVDVEQRMGSQAVWETRGQVLTFEGDFIDALYTSTCGGHTENVENVFDGPAVAYLVSRPCYSEQPAGRMLAGARPALGLEIAGALILGLVEPGEIDGDPLSQPATASEVSRWARRAVGRLGQNQCRSLTEGDAPVTVSFFTESLAGLLCWEGRLSFLLSSGDVDRLVPASEAPEIGETARRALAYWIREQWILPPANGLDPQRVLSRGEVLESLYRLVASRGHPPLTEAIVLSVDSGSEGERIVVDSGEKEETFQLAEHRYLFRKINSSVSYAPRLSVLPGDRILFHPGEEGIDLLVLASHETAFDRSSSFARWTVRKTHRDITRGMNERERLGNVIDLRPKRYGKSGRVAELEVVGEAGSVVLRGLAIRRSLGIRENLFFIDRQLTSNGDVAAWIFTGGGWGHGVGMCQVGAYGMALAGHDYLEILSHYYPGTRLVSLAE